MTNRRPHQPRFIQNKVILFSYDFCSNNSIGEKESESMESYHLSRCLNRFKMCQLKSPPSTVDRGL